MLYKILKYPFFGNYMVKWRNPIPADERKEWRQLTVKSKSGATLKGLFASSKTVNEKATIVLGHPMGKEAKGYFIKRGYTDLLRKNGFNTLIFDINGFGESTNGNFSYFEDIVAIGIKAKTITPKLPIGYFGISLGDQWSTIAFADEGHRYDFAIVESSATTLEEFWKRFPFAYRTLKFLNIILPKYTRKIKMIERIKEAKRLKSLLLIYSHKDSWVPFDMGRRFLKNSPVPTELWSVEDSRHAEIMRSKHKKEYQEKIVSFFNTESRKVAIGDNSQN
ncbi:alpha/beta hydrolase [Aquimarina sp. Aq107]|uniref:alpha/beta hydrolase n=1 Tax=Aquimarina sp. Aq107 TaxID=1191912 RepID=UPI000D54E580|nr:prolyl oligopeptidase family serine peptidase [Aquimarina sp. Aq107]